MAHAPRLLVTGAAGFLGRRLVDRLARRWRIVALDIDPPAHGQRASAGEVVWSGVDLGDPEQVGRLGAELSASGGVQAVIHLAAYYDFTGREHPEYRRTNVEGTRLLLDACADLDVERFFFASSLAASEFPRGGRKLDESSPADGSHVYARSKRAGEELIRRERRFPTAIVRFAALYSDWCEYAPLYHLLGTWSSTRWNSRILGGQGRSAVPYLHARDACLFLERCLERRRDLEPAEILLASPNDVASHAELFHAATQYVTGTPLTPIRMPKPLARLGIRALDVLGRLRGRRPFEQPWMGPMIDRRLEVDARHTHARLGWTPRERLDVLRRIPFLIENQRTEPGTWSARNEATLHLPALPPQVQILRLFEEHEEALSRQFTEALQSDPIRFPHYSAIGADEHRWNHQQLLRNLSQSVRTRHRGQFRAFCLETARRLAKRGLDQSEPRAVLLTFERICQQQLGADPRAAGVRALLHEHVARTIEFGLDGVEEAYEERGVNGVSGASGASGKGAAAA